MTAGMTGMTTEMMIESAAHAPARLALVLRGLNQHFTMCGNHKIKDIRRIILQIRKGATQGAGHGRAAGLYAGSFLFFDAAGQGILHLSPSESATHTITARQHSESSCTQSSYSTSPSSWQSWNPVLRQHPTTSLQKLLRPRRKSWGRVRDGGVHADAEHVAPSPRIGG